MCRDFGRDPKKGSYAIGSTKYCTSDFVAAVPITQLICFDELSAKREKHAAFLRAELENAPGIIPQEHYPESTHQNYYVFSMRYDAQRFHGAPRSKVTEALCAEGIPAAIYPPLNKEPFIEQNLSSRGFRAAFSMEWLEKYRRQNYLPQNDQLLCATSLPLPQEALMGGKSDVDDGSQPFNKVQKNASTLA